MKSFTQDPNSVLDYTFDWSDWLSAGENINSRVWTISPVGLSNVNTTSTTSTETIWVSGGTLGQDYKISCRITTNSTPTARIDERTFKVLIQER